MKILKIFSEFSLIYADEFPYTVDVIDQNDQKDTTVWPTQKKSINSKNWKNFGEKTDFLNGFIERNKQGIT